ncbi:MAG: hypothetical protein GY696_00895 [Gammaproteobacteria bacterium]|nr:hypothetical protein [Gammaproteobacteria bacterium]
MDLTILSKGTSQRVKYDTVCNDQDSQGDQVQADHTEERVQYLEYGRCIVQELADTLVVTLMIR